MAMPNRVDEFIGNQQQRSDNAVFGTKQDAVQQAVTQARIQSELNAAIQPGSPQAAAMTHAVPNMPANVMGNSEMDRIMAPVIARQLAQGQPAPTQPAQPNIGQPISTEQRAQLQAEYGQPQTAPVEDVAVGGQQSVAPAMAPGQVAPNATRGADAHKKNKQRVQAATAKALVDESPLAVDAVNTIKQGAASDNLTDKSAANWFEKNAMKYMNQVMSGERTPISAADAYEKKMKDAPYYKNNKMWGAVAALGLTLIAGGDPRMGIIAGAMAYGDINQREKSHLKDLKLSDAKAFAAFDKKQSELAQKAYDNMNKEGAASLAREGVVADREDEQAWKTGEKQLDRTAAKQTAAQTLKTRLAAEDRKAKLTAQPRIREIDSQIEEGKIMVTELAQSYKELARIEGELGIDMTGPIDKWRGKWEQLKDSEAGRAYTAELRAQERQVPALIQQMKGLGSLSDSDMRAITAPIPGPDAQLSERRAYMERIKGVQERQTRALERERGELYASYGEELPQKYNRSEPKGEEVAPPAGYNWKK